MVLCMFEFRREKEQSGFDMGESPWGGILAGGREVSSEDCKHTSGGRAAHGGTCILINNKEIEIEIIILRLRGNTNC